MPEFVGYQEQRCRSRYAFIEPSGKSGRPALLPRSAIEGTVRFIDAPRRYDAVCIYLDDMEIGNISPAMRMQTKIPLQPEN